MTNNNLYISLSDVLANIRCIESGLCPDDSAGYTLEHLEDFINEKKSDSKNLNQDYFLNNKPMVQYYKIDKGGYPWYIKVTDRYTKPSLFSRKPQEYIVYNEAGYIAERISKSSSILFISELTEEEYNRYEQQMIELNSLIK